MNKWNDGTGTAALDCPRLPLLTQAVAVRDGHRCCLAASNYPTEIALNAFGRYSSGRIRSQRRRDPGFRFRKPNRIFVVNALNAA